jgi:uncharacterized RDD family membrane protein YckC
VNRQPWGRLVAMLVDWFCILAWVAISAAVGVPLYLNGATHPMGVLASNLVAVLVTVVPATVALSWLESSPREASIGKRVRHLRVVDAATGSRVSLRRSILRNTLKIGVPWTIGHAAVFSIVQASESGSVPVAVWLLTIVAYVLPIMYIVFLFVGEGRTPYDLISGTIVIQEVQAGLDRSAAGRRGVRSRREHVGRAPQPLNRSPDRSGIEKRQSLNRN